VAPSVQRRKVWLTPVNLHRIPRFTPSDVDTVRMAESVVDVKQQVQSLTAQFNELKQGLIEKSSEYKLTSHSSTVSDFEPPVAPADAVRTVDADGLSPAVPDVTFAEMFQTKDDNGQWFVVSKNRRQPKPVARRIITKGCQDHAALKLKSVTRDQPKVWHTFVGRLDPATSPEEVSSYLDDAGISVVSCTALPKTQEWHNKYAAFRVVVSFDHKDKMFDDELRPAGTDVRDWKFSTRSSHSSHGDH